MVSTSSAKPSSDRGRMKPLRYPFLWLAGGIVLMLLVLYFSLMPIGGRHVGIGDKFAHFLVFLFLMVWFCGVFRGLRLGCSRLVFLSRFCKAGSRTAALNYSMPMPTREAS